MNKAFFLFFTALFILGSTTALWAQITPDFSREWRFAQYLTDKESYDEAAYVLAHIRPDNSNQQDSLAYFRGWISYNIKSLDSASQQLLSVSDRSPFFLKSQYFGAYCLAFQGKYTQATSVLTQLNPADTTTTELKAVQLAGLALLQRNYNQYDQYQQSFRYSSYALANEQKRFDDYRRQLASAKKRSPVLAGLYSAILPGAGKVYAGKTKQGIAAFLPVLTLGLLTYEGLHKDGPRSARFLGFGSLFTVFYIGNIWGSALSVKINRSEFNRTYDNKILFDMHIPLRNLFN